MADEEVVEEDEEEKEQEDEQRFPVVLVAGVAVIAIAIIVVILMLSRGPSIAEAKPVVEYVVKEKMYQLKDGSHLLLEFSVVIEEDKLSAIKMIIEKESPGRLPNGINMIVANKGREDIISGTHKREAFARELKKMLEERVLEAYNKKQKSTQDIIEIKEVLISSLVTQSG
jgi:hypothetical protein